MNQDTIAIQEDLLRAYITLFYASRRLQRLNLLGIMNRDRLARLRSAITYNMNEVTLRAVLDFIRSE